MQFLNQILKITFNKILTKLYKELEIGSYQ